MVYMEFYSVTKITELLIRTNDIDKYYNNYTGWKKRNKMMHILYSFIHKNPETQSLVKECRWIVMCGLRLVLRQKGEGERYLDCGHGSIVLYIMCT